MDVIHRFRDYPSKFIYSVSVLGLCLLCFIQRAELLVGLFSLVLFLVFCDDFHLQGRLRSICCKKGWFVASAGVVILSSTCATNFSLWAISGSCDGTVSTVCSVDILAYFGGKSKGRRKLAP